MCFRVASWTPVTPYWTHRPTWIKIQIGCMPPWVRHSWMYVPLPVCMWRRCAKRLKSHVDTARAALQQSAEKPFNQMLVDLHVRLQTRHVLPWSRWITPRKSLVSSKRFDTRFFVAAVPHAQEATHDNHEATESVWLPPRVALEQYWNRQIELAPPQIMSLAHLARHTSVDSVMEAARITPPPLILPEAFDEDGTPGLCYPGDPAHSVAQRAMPGQTRLLYRNNHFEPAGGFETLFD